MKMTNNKQNYFKIKDLFDQAISGDNNKAENLRALLDTEDMKEMQKFITQVELQNPKIRKCN